MSPALPSHKVSSGSKRAVDPDAVAREKLVLEQLTDEMNRVQKRLGTTAEQNGDCQLARELAHAIRNKLHLLRLWGVFDGPKRGPKYDHPDQLFLNI